jgi:hypothetical protein
MQPHPQPIAIAEMKATVEQTKVMTPMHLDGIALPPDPLRQESQSQFRQQFLLVG